MSTVLIVVALVVLVALAGAALYFWKSRSRGLDGPALKRRFGPEYDLAVARHGGDTEAAERELAGRVERYGRLRLQPLAPEARERYTERWEALQKRFVDAPREAVVEAGALLDGLAQERGFPAAADHAHDEQVAALSVHHAGSVDAYRRVRGRATGAADDVGAGTSASTGTEQLRTELLEARRLFDELIAEGRRTPHRHPEARGGRHVPRPRLSRS
ncbi:hypothetical protein AB0A69_28550 [Streptomyces sp. NPDC045431]|uniref:hypothetical protein n=1 Tax=Streptomyces sp. NPDC045431 TaxID=3155613 RepID=UPI0033D46D7E